ncbi:hypothetical protein AGMMS49546_30240 [Spirochaetia bacterium]|nr:hypothetical protein AGMMS49546_30240 [Spirochaetia bacterium]
MSPNLGFLLKLIDVYQLDPAEKLNFLFKVLMDTEKIEIPLLASLFKAKKEFIGLLAIFLLNGSVEYPQEDKDVWANVRELYNILIPFTALKV